LVDAIQCGNFPKWTISVQVMDEDQGYKLPFAFDATKVWPHREFPLIEIGVLELNRNVTDFHAEVEQSAFSPGNVVPGISFSPDKLLQGRIFAYGDTQRYRLGVNFQQLHVNCPIVHPYNYNQGGLAMQRIEERFPNYQPNSFGGPLADPNLKEPPMRLEGKPFADHYPPLDEDYWTQPGNLFRLMDEGEKLRLADNIAKSLEGVPGAIVDRQLRHFYKADPRYGELVEKSYNMRMNKEVERSLGEKLALHALRVMQSKDPKCGKLTSEGFVEHSQVLLAGVSLTKKTVEQEKEVVRETQPISTQ